MLSILVGVILSYVLTHQSQALSTPSKPSPLRKSTSNINDDAIAKRTVSNIFSVISHIQNPDLYQPSWADNTRYEKGTNYSEGKTVVASRDVKKGHFLTLFPIHALGLRTLGQKNTSTKKKKKKKQLQKQKDTEFVAYDVDRDAKYFTNQEPGLRMKLNIPLDNSQPALCVLNGDRKNKVLFAMVFRDEVLPGWMGHRIKTANTGANCVTIPLPGAGPLCAIISTTDIKEGDAIVQGVKAPDTKLLNECKAILANEYQTEISELHQFIKMACPQSDNTSTDTQEDAGLLGPFHQINKQYPGLKQIHESPDIYLIENFLSADECDRIIAKAEPHLTPCLVKNELTGLVEQDSSRMSTDANLPQSEAPTIVSKLTNLASCSASQLEILQVLKYTKGQEFKLHTDGYSGPVSACG